MGCLRACGTAQGKGAREAAPDSPEGLAPSLTSTPSAPSLAKTSREEG